VVERLGQKLTKNELGGWEIQLKAGAVDDAVDTEEEAFARVRGFLSYLPSSIDEVAPRGPRDDDPARRADWLIDPIPRDIRQPARASGSASMPSARGRSSRACARCPPSGRRRSRGARSSCATASAWPAPRTATGAATAHATRGRRAAGAPCRSRAGSKRRIGR